MAITITMFMAYDAMKKELETVKAQRDEYIRVGIVKETDVNKRLQIMDHMTTKIESLTNELIMMEKNA